MGLGLGSVVYTPNGPEDMNGKVYSQNPKSGIGDSVRVGNSIDIFVYGKEPEENERIGVEEVND